MIGAHKEDGGTASAMMAKVKCIENNLAAAEEVKDTRSPDQTDVEDIVGQA